MINHFKLTQELSVLERKIIDCVPVFEIARSLIKGEGFLNEIKKELVEVEKKRPVSVKTLMFVSRMLAAPFNLFLRRPLSNLFVLKFLNNKFLYGKEDKEAFIRIYLKYEREITIYKNEFKKDNIDFINKDGGYYKSDDIKINIVNVQFLEYIDNKIKEFCKIYSEDESKFRKEYSSLFISRLVNKENLNFLTSILNEEIYKIEKSKPVVRGENVIDIKSEKVKKT